MCSNSVVCAIIEDLQRKIPTRYKAGAPEIYPRCRCYDHRTSHVRLSGIFNPPRVLCYSNERRVDLLHQ